MPVLSPFCATTNLHRPVWCTVDDEHVKPGTEQDQIVRENNGGDGLVWPGVNRGVGYTAQRFWSPRGTGTPA